MNGVVSRAHMLFMTSSQRVREDTESHGKFCTRGPPHPRFMDRPTKRAAWVSVVPFAPQVVAQFLWARPLAARPWRLTRESLVAPIPGPAEPK